MAPILATSLLEWKEEGRDVRWATAVRFPAVLSLSVRPTASKPASQPNHPGGRAGRAGLAAVGERDSHGRRRRRHYSWSASLPWERETDRSVLSVCLLSAGEDRPPMT